MLIVILNFGRIFGEFRAIHAFSRAEYVLRTFSQFKVILFYARYLKLIYVGNLGTIIGAKLCHAVTLSRLNISYVDGTPEVQKG